MRNWLIVLRKEKNHTQKFIAKSVGITRQMISAIEKGSANPSIDVAKSIGELLEFRWTAFFDEEESKKIEEELSKIDKSYNPKI